MTLLNVVDPAKCVVAPVPTLQSPPPPRSTGRHEYDDVNVMLRHLATFTVGSSQWRRHREAIVVRCLPLAEHIARRFVNRGIEFDDLLQVARVGLLGALNRFDLDNGDDFLSFAVPTMMGEVRRHFRDRGWAVRVPRRLKDLNLRASSKISEMSQSIGRAPTATELADELDIDREEVVQLLIARDCYSLRSLDAQQRHDGDPETLGATFGAVDAGYDQVLNREVLRDMIAELDERERTVLCMRFFETMTQSQIAERIGISQMHVSRILSRTLQRLRTQLQ
jgi:RNA polymerase sigma-B factor